MGLLNRHQAAVASFLLDLSTIPDLAEKERRHRNGRERLLQKARSLCQRVMALGYAGCGR